MTWDDLKSWLKLDAPADRKECGGYVLGELRETTDRHKGDAHDCTAVHRSKESIVSRAVVALDADYAEPSFVTDALGLDCALAIYTTYSHTLERPRYRLLAPLSRFVTPDEYRLIADALMHDLGTEQFDLTSRQPERFMFRPSAQGDDYESYDIDGDPLDADEWLTWAKELGLDQRPTSEATAAPYDGPGYDELTPGQQVMATAHLQRSIDQWKARLAEAATWDEGVKDEKGWGWEELSYRSAWALARLAVTPWVGWDEDKAADCYAEILPDEIAADEKCGGKWDDGIVARAAASSEPLDQPPWVVSDFVDEPDDEDPDQPPVGAGTGVGGKRVPIAVRLREHVQGHYDVFPAGDDGRIFVQAKTGGRAELLNSGFVMRASQGIGSASSTLSAAATEAAKVLTAHAEAHAPRPLAMRVHYSPGRIVLDLAQPGNTRCVVVRGDGWTVCDVPPAGVVFMHSGLPLPEPIRGGSADELRELLRWAEDDPRWPLVKGWLPAALLADRPRPILGFFGPQGSAKTTTGRFVVGVLDPKPGGVLGSGFGKNGADDETKSVRSYLPSWDNVSALSSEGADRLSRLVTGDMIEKRKLYTDADMVTIQFRRTGVITGVTVPRGLKPDTLDRFILVPLPPLTGARLSEGVLDAEWTYAHPRVLGGVLDLAVRMLDRLEQARGQNSAGLRMADYAEALWAVDPELYDAYARNVGSARSDMAEDDPFIVQIVDRLKWQGAFGLKALRKAGLDLIGQPWHDSSDGIETTVSLGDDSATVEVEATANDLRMFAGHGVDIQEQWWPRNGKVFSDEITRTIELLRAAGVTVTDRKSDGRRLKKLTLTFDPGAVEEG